MSTLSRLEEKIRAGWLGKVIGGTLGAPYEGYAGKLNLNFYDPVPSHALPNDDLDLQVVWLRHLLDRKATAVRPADLAEAWGRHVGFPWSEYAVGLRNRHYGLEGARLGSFDNWWAEGMGAAIRSELWAFVAAGDPARAAAYAWADATFDHAGDGVYAEIFFAVLEANAFGGGRIEALIEQGLAAIPPASRTAFAVRRTQFLWSQIGEWTAVREILLAEVAQLHFTDIEINVAFTILGLLAGGGDFARSICIANNCGWDTDCTAATVGSILGILDPSSIPAAWAAPIGGRVLLNAQIIDMPLETTLDELTEQTLRLRRQLTEPAAVGEIVPRRRSLPDDSPIRVPYRAACLDVPMARVDAPPAPSGHGHEAAGHWMRHAVENVRAVSLHFSFEVRIEDDRPVRFMAFLPRPCRTFVDGKPYADWNPSSWTPGWHGPSFHLYAERAVDGTKPSRAPAITLTPGVHRFDVVFDHDGTDAAELVVGAADAQTDLWLPFALALRK